METYQLSMFDEIDPVLEKFNSQLDIIIIRYRLNGVWKSQNRMQYTLYSVNREITVECTLDHVIHESISLKWERRRKDECLFTLNPKLNVWIKEKDNSLIVLEGENK